MRTTRAIASGSPRLQHGPSGGTISSLCLPLVRAQPELGRDRAGQLAQLDGLRAQRHRRVEPAEVEQLAGQAGEAPQLAPRDRHLALGVVDVHPPVAQVLLEQLHRALEHRQRGAQLVRGGGHERAAGVLLPRQLLLHAPERAGEVADLVAALVVLERRVGDALLGDPHHGGAQAAEAAQQRARQRDGERDRDEQPDRAGGEQSVAHLLDRGGDLGQPPFDDQHAHGPLRAEQADPDPHDVALDVGGGGLRAQGAQRHERGAAGGGAGAGVVREVVGARGRRRARARRCAGAAARTARRTAARGPPSRTRAGRRARRPAGWTRSARAAGPTAG